jgi:hypothetical protein
MDWKKNSSPAERLPIARTRSRLTGSGANNRTIDRDGEQITTATQETRHKSGCREGNKAGSETESVNEVDAWATLPISVRTANEKKKNLVLKT